MPLSFVKILSRRKCGIVDHKKCSLVDSVSRCNFLLAVNFDWPGWNLNRFVDLVGPAIVLVGNSMQDCFSQVCFC